MPRNLSAIIIVLLITLIIGISACTSTSPAPNAATQTLQAERSLKLATSMAEQLQVTNQVRYAYVTATADALESSLEVARSWPLVFQDPFEEDRDLWPIGVEDDELAKISWEIRDGKYIWEASAYGGFVWWGLPESEIVTDFYLEVEVQIISGPQDAEAGLVFRSDGEDSYYNLGITNAGSYSLYLHSPAGWEAILDWTATSLIKPDQSNKLAVIALGEYFYFFINDSYLTTITDDRLSSGEAGLIIGLSQAGEEASWQFDNYLLRSSQGEQVEASAK